MCDAQTGVRLGQRVRPGPQELTDARDAAADPGERTGSLTAAGTRGRWPILPLPRPPPWVRVIPSAEVVMMLNMRTPVGPRRVGVGKPVVQRLGQRRVGVEHLADVRVGPGGRDGLPHRPDRDRIAVPAGPTARGPALTVPAARQRQQRQR